MYGQLFLSIFVCFFLCSESFASDVKKESSKEVHLYDTAKTKELACALDTNTASLPSIIQQLIEKDKADPRTKSQTWGRTALYIAVIKGNAALCRTVLDHGADPNEKFLFGGEETPAIMYASSSDVLATLIEKHADITIKDDDGGTPLHYHASNPSVQTGDTLALLSNAGCNPNAQDKNGNTALHACCQNPLSFNSYKAAALLLTGARSVQNKQGKLPRDCLDFAIKDEFDTTVKVTADYLGIPWNICKEDINRRLTADKAQRRKQEKARCIYRMTFVDMPFSCMEGSPFPKPKEDS